MSDYMCGEITIGGKIPASLVPVLCEAIDRQNVSLDWGDACVEFGTAEDLLESLNETGHLVLCNDQAPYGAFWDLEEVLRQHGIAYDRRSDAKYEHDFCLSVYRSGWPEAKEYLTTSDHEPVVAVSYLKKIARLVDEALECAAGGNAAQAAERLQLARAEFKTHLPEIPKLPPLEIVDGTAGDAD